MPFNLVCPSSRGLSLAIARELLHKSPLPLVITTRSSLSDSKEHSLSSLSIDSSFSDRVTVLHVDVTQEETLHVAASHIRSKFNNDHVQYLFSTPGILHPERSAKKLEKREISETLDVNLLGPLLTMKHFSPFLPSKASIINPSKPSVWACLSARVGSISDNRLGGWYSYRASKAGLNQAMKTFDIEVERASGGHALVVGLHPGTVKTGLSKEFWGSVEEGKLFEPDFAAAKLVGLVMGMTEKQRGKVWDWKGERVEW